MIDSASFLNLLMTSDSGEAAGKNSGRMQVKVEPPAPPLTGDAELQKIYNWVSYVTVIRHFSLINACYLAGLGGLLVFRKGVSFMIYCFFLKNSSQGSKASSQRD